MLACTGLRESGDDTALYSTRPPQADTPIPLTFIPYFVWANRGEGEMTVWLRDARS